MSFSLEYTTRHIDKTNAIEEAVEKDVAPPTELSASYASVT